MANKLFVYGTLRPSREGCDSILTHNYARIRKSVSAWEPAKLEGAVMHSHKYFPGILPGEGVVVGDLLTVTDKALNICDMIEGHPAIYNRQQVTVQTADGPVQAWVYWAPEKFSTLPVIQSGDWLNR